MRTSRAPLTRRSYKKYGDISMISAEPCMTVDIPRLHLLALVGDGVVVKHITHACRGVELEMSIRYDDTSVPFTIIPRRDLYFILRYSHRRRSRGGGRGIGPPTFRTGGIIPHFLL